MEIHSIMSRMILHPDEPVALVSQSDVKENEPELEPIEIPRKKCLPTCCAAGGGAPFWHT